MGAGFGCVALQGLESLSARGADRFGAGRSGVRRIDPLRPYEAREPDFRPRAKSIIFLFMVGGPSQIDTFDYKPLLQSLNGKPVPESIKKNLEATKHANVFRGCKEELMASPYRWRQHGESGMWVSDLFPHLAKRFKNLACSAMIFLLT